MKKIGIIGGGASGMMAAIAAAREGAEVTVLEHTDRIGRKILVTGNGKCNFTNLKLSKDDYNGNHPSFVTPVLAEFSVSDTLYFFEELGLLWKEKNGCVYPVSNQAATVLDVLRFALERHKVAVKTATAVQNIQKTANGFLLKTNQGTFDFDRIILACGGKAAPKTGSDGSGYSLAGKLDLKLVPPVPALTACVSNQKYFKGITGVRCDAALQLYIDNKYICTEAGELQITDYGISGIPVFQFSRYVSCAMQKKQSAAAVVDLLPGITSEQLLERLMKQLAEQKSTMPGISLEQFLTGILHKKLVGFMIKQTGYKPSNPIDSFGQRDLMTLIHMIKEWHIPLTGTNSFEQAQVCAGGVDTREIDRYLMAKRHPGLYIIGEMLDIDGRCGGYNLQWAWSSGYVAGRHAAKDVYDSN